MEAYMHIENKIASLGESRIYINSYNDDYDNIVVISFYESRNSADIAFTKTQICRYIDFQVRIRDTSFENAYSRIEAIRNMFYAYKYQVIDIMQKGDIMMLGNDSKNRSELTINFKMKLIGGNTVT